MRLLSSSCSNRVGLLDRKKEPVLGQQLRWISAYGNQFTVYSRIVSRCYHFVSSTTLFPLKTGCGCLKDRAAVFLTVNKSKKWLWITVNYLLFFLFDQRLSWKLGNYLGRKSCGVLLLLFFYTVAPFSCPWKNTVVISRKLNGMR